MKKNDMTQSQIKQYQSIQSENQQMSFSQKSIAERQRIRPIRVIMAISVIAMVLFVLFVYNFIQKNKMINNVEYVTDQMVNQLADNIANEIDYAESSIKLAAISISQTMTSDTLDNPSDVILPMIENTPFGGIEYIRADGMNVMNIGEPFDASNRIYYIEGIQGNTGIWNNYHPKTSRETLMNFYTPLVYENKIVGVITGYIEATTQLVPLFKAQLFGENIHGLILDEDNMVICTTIQSEYEKDLTLDKFMDRFAVTEEQKEQMRSILNAADNVAVPFRDANGEGRICVSMIPGTSWKVAVIVPALSFRKIINDNTSASIIAIVIISLILIIYALTILIRNIKRQKEFASKNKKLEADNQTFNEENQRAFAEISEIRDIIASANMGTWRIELVENREPRMFVDQKMMELLGLEGQKCTPEKIYMDWFNNIKPESVKSVLQSVEKMQQGYFDENTYLWMHPVKGIRYVRCGGTAEKIEGGYLLRGYHYDVDDVVRAEQAQMILLKETLEKKNEYYSTLGALGDIFYSMHVIDLVKDTVVEVNAQNEVKAIANREDRASQLMAQVISTVTVEEYKEEALRFTDLTSLADKMKNKIIISKELVGKNIGWFLASFITMQTDENGRLTKVIFTTRVIDEEKKQEEKLIHESQTDELTGLLNRRAYEDDIYERNDVPNSDDFNYISLDVNGLKVVNDTLGHVAGDELIMGACQCMKRCLGAYGKIYRVGGDEFVAILSCDNNKLKEVLFDFDNALDNWSGKLIDHISVSYGCACREDDPNASVRQLGTIAEQRMYEAKAEHYRKSGVDRRGQQDAHKALCQLYTKILKINITDDTYQVVNMDDKEKTADKGFTDKISEWFSEFGRTGQVHPEDLQDYLKSTDLGFLRDFFAGNKAFIHIFYRRKYEGEFKRTMMEMVRANDYSDENQSLFLYVKNIE